MFSINIDSGGYYAEGNDGTLVEIEDMPPIDDVRYLPAYKYDDSTHILVCDEEKQAKIKKEIEDEQGNVQPSMEERLSAIEEVMLELLSNQSTGGK